VSALMGRPPTDMWLHTTPQRFATRNDWQDNICSAFVPLEIRAPRSEPFHNLTANRTLGHINISELVTSAQQVRRTPALAARSEQASYKFSIQLSGQSQVTQDGRSTLLKSGDWCFYDTSRPYAVDVDSGSHFLVLLISASALEPWNDRMRSRVATRFGFELGTACVALDALRSLAAQQQALTPDEAYDISATVLRLFALSLSSHADGGGASSLEEVRQAQLHVIQKYIHEHLHDDEMTATALAEHFRMSRRYLYKLFASKDLSPADYILGARLDRCRELLSDPAYTRQIGELAHTYGFTSTSTFSHAFKRRFDQSPSDWRLNALTSAQSSNC